MKYWTFIVLSMGMTITVQAFGKSDAKKHVINHVGLKHDAELRCIKCEREKV